MSDTAIIEVRDLRVAFRNKGSDVEVLRGVSFDLEPGRDPRAGRQLRLRQDDDAARDPRPPSPWSRGDRRVDPLS